MTMSEKLPGKGERLGPDDAQIEEVVATLRRALKDLRFGSISLTVHDARVVQVDVTEKRRF